MTIQCPSCHASGTIDESRLPSSGMMVVCPACGHGFTVKPPPKKWSRFMMNTCPVCDYSTFSEETFAVCPRCGLDGEEYHTKRLERERLERQQRIVEQEMIPPLPPSGGSHYTVSRQEPSSADPSSIPWVVRSVGWGVVLVAIVTGIAGLVGVVEYLGTDWHQKIMEESGEEVGRFSIFLSRGALPFSMTGYALFAACAAFRFMRRDDSGKRLVTHAAWGLMGVVVLREVQDVVRWFGRSSDRASIGYYLAGLSGGVLMTLLWVGLIYLFIRFLDSETFDDLSGG